MDAARVGPPNNRQSLSALFRNLEFEGHPALWHLILYPFTRVTGDPVVLKGVQFFFASAVLALVWLRSPFRLEEKCLISLSYHLVFNYAMMSRSYALGIALTFLFVSCRRCWNRHPRLAWLTLGLLANVHFFFAVLTATLAALWLWESRERKAAFKGVSLYLVLMGAAALSILHPDNIAGPTIPWFFKFSSKRILVKLGTFGNAFAPIRAWNQWTYWDPVMSKWKALLIALVVILAILAYLWREKFAFAAYSAFCLILIIFFYVRHGGYIWHSGLFFVALLAVVWWVRESGRDSLGPRALFLALLVLNALGGLKAVVGSKVQPLTSGQQSAAWIREHGLENEFWVSYPAFPGFVVGAFLDRPTYQVETESFERFARWGLQTEVAPEKLHVLLQRACEKEHKNIIYLAIEGGFGIRAQGIPQGLEQTFEMEELKRLQGSKMENFVLYRLTRKAGQEATPSQKTPSP